MLQVGSLVDNKYKILSEVGHGGMSVVYLAINERANKTWAVKEVRKDGVCDFEAVKQGLVVETDMLKKLNHPHLPSIIDVIDTEDSFLIVMDYIEGRSLQSVLKHGGAQPKDQVVEWGKQLCDVLGYLHSREPAIIYRDMKPANVMLKPDGDITLIDFGTAREFKNRTMVEDTTCLGTRGYAAPEQFGGRGQTDARTDIYCLGATLYHLVTGHSPAEPPYEIKPLSYWDPSYAGSGLELIINRCCQQDPDARYQSCAELMYDLEHVNDIDYGTQKARKRKWHAFLASIGVCLLGVAGMIGFSIAKNDAVSNTYDYYMDQAQMKSSSEEFEDFVEIIKKAIEIDPSKYEAYDALIDRIEADNVFDPQTENEPIETCLRGEFSGSGRTNESALLDADVEGYADIQYRVGKLMFLMSDGSANYLADSAPYFNKALVQGEMEEATDSDTQKKARIAKALKTIGENIENMNSQGLYDDEDRYSYDELWEDLQGLYEDNAIDSMGSRSYGIALYKQIASLIRSNYQEFKVQGVSYDDMLTLLADMEAVLQETKNNLTASEKNSKFDELVEQALTGVGTARDQIKTMQEADEK